MTSTQRHSRLVVARRWTGLGDCVFSLLAAHRYAVATRRTLVADWRGSPLAEPGHNLFADLFEPIETLGGAPFIGGASVGSLALPAPSYPPGWTREALDAAPAHGERIDLAATLALIESGEDRPEPTVIFDGCLIDALPSSAQRRALLRELRPRAHVAAAVDSFRAERFEGRSVIGVHIRHGNGGDIMGHARYWARPGEAMRGLARVLVDVLSALRIHGADPVLFLATDSREVEAALRSGFPHLVTRPKRYRAAGAGELHHGEAAALGRDDALTEMLLLAHADVLVRYPPGSLFSAWGATCKSPCPEGLSRTPEASSLDAEVC